MDGRVFSPTTDVASVTGGSKGDIVVSDGTKLVTSAGGWTTALDLDLSAEANQTLGSDTTFTVGGLTWTKRNSTNDQAAMAIVNGSGLVIQPKTTGDWTGAVYTAPVLELLLSALASGAIVMGRALRVWTYISAENSAANPDLSKCGISSQSMRGYAGYRGFLTSPGSCCAVTTNYGVSATDAATNTTAVAPITVGAANNVQVLQIPTLGLVQAMLYTGQYSSGWPAESAITPRASVVAGTGLMQTLTVANASLALAASRVGSATAYSVTIARVRVDFR